MLGLSLQCTITGSGTSRPNSDISDFNHFSSCTFVAIPLYSLYLNEILWFASLKPMTLELLLDIP